MRVRIVFGVKNRGGYVPFHHQYLLSHLAKDVIRTGNGLFKDYSYFNFSGLKGQTKISRHGLHFYSSKVTLVLSAESEDFIQFFLQKLFCYPEILLGTLIIVPESVDRESEPVFEEANKYVCISPLVLTDAQSESIYAKKFILPESDTFSDLLYDSTMARMEASRKYSSEEIASFYKFQIIPDKTYLKKIKEGDKKFARIYTVYDEYNEKHEVRGYTFPFVLYAGKEVQKFIFECGLGSYSYKGFGMVDLANVELQRKIEEYDFNPQKLSA